MAASPPDELLTEEQVMSRAVVLLLEDGVLDRSPRTISRTAATLHISVNVIREQWKSSGQWNRRTSWKGSVRPSEPVEEPEPYVSPPPSAGGKKAGRRAYGDNMREDGEGGWERRCSTCEGWFPATPDWFQIKDKKTGKLASACLSCRDEYQRTRYLSVKAVKALDEVGLEFAVVEADPHLVCKGCGDPIVPGQKATVHGPGYHSGCRPTGETNSEPAAEESMTSA